MNEGGDGTPDPFSEGDQEAGERERRRREREQRRRQKGERERSEGTRRSLGELVGRRPGRRSPTVSGPTVPAPEPPKDAPASPKPVPEPDELTPEPRERLSAGPPQPAPQPSEPARPPIMARRLLAGGAVLAAIAVIFVVVNLAGGSGEQTTVAAPPPPLKTVNVTVPEGLTIDQIADVAKKAKLKGSYLKATRKALKTFPLKRYDAKGADTLEGFLFPATYELEKNAPAADLVAKQLDAFEQNFAGVDEAQARKKKLTPYDVLTIASMIEKEVQVADERPIVAAVIYNRLAAGDTLGIDATLRYELQNYDKQLLQSELDAATPYNTRINPGLPPTPISNPGLASIEAAASPAKTDAYYFVVKPGTCGEHTFTADPAEFEAAQAAYQKALAEQGGSPTDCPG